MRNFALTFGLILVLGGCTSIVNEVTKEPIQPDGSGRTLEFSQIRQVVLVL